MKRSCFARTDSSLSAASTSSSVAFLLISWSSSQAKYSVNAAPSRIWQFRIPSSSTSFFTAFASPIGLRTSSTRSSPPRALFRAHDARFDVKNFFFFSDVSPFVSNASALRAATSLKMALYGLIVTLSPKCSLTSAVSLLSSTYKVACVGVTTAYEKKTGL